MMKLRPSLKNLARRALLLNLLILLSFIWGCSSSTSPTYCKENLPQAIEEICKNEYKIDVKAKLIGQTIWVYIPLENIAVKSDKPEKYVEKFELKDNRVDFKDNTIKLTYLIKAVPEQEKFQDIKYDKVAAEKINSVWRVLRRLLLSTESSQKNAINFFCLVTADIKNGFEIKEIFYQLDLRKVSYDFISWTEFHHRSIQDMEIAPDAIGDKEGTHLLYRDIPWQDFIVDQIEHRIKLKFQKPEVERNADIDKEITKIITHTLNIYGFKDFSTVELDNLATQKKIILNRAAILAGPTQ